MRVLGCAGAQSVGRIDHRALHRPGRRYLPQVTTIIDNHRVT
jgi:hypothetical protein